MSERGYRCGIANHGHADMRTYRHKMGTQPADGVFRYIRGQLADNGAECIDADLLVALDQPVGQIVVHKDIPPTGGIAIILLGLVL